MTSQGMHTSHQAMQSAAGIDGLSAQQKEAMKKLERQFVLSKEQCDAIVRSFSKEMEAGLAVRQASSATEPHGHDTKMIPSFVTGYPSGYEQGTYLALEISGVDIYVCQVQLKGEGGKLAINQYQYKIPDDLAAGDDIGVLIDYVADCVADFQERIHENVTEKHSYAMAISIGFAVRQTGLKEGIIVALEHGFEFPGVVGRDAVQLFDEHFQKKGLNIKIVAIANDAVCTLLAHAYQHPTTRIGIVHSAGTNCAYYDKVSNMRRFLEQWQADQSDVALDKHMIINTEWCSFGAQYLPVNDFDVSVDRESNNRSIHQFEKMTTGMYLGEIVRQILVSLIDRKLFSAKEEGKECLLRAPYHFDTSYMYVCEADNDLESLKDTRVVMEEMCGLAKTSLADRRMVKYVCELVGRRAAVLLGAGIAGVVNYMHECGVGHLNQDDGFAIAISGDVYKDYPRFHLHVCETLKELLPDMVSNRLSVGIVKHSRIVGAAIVAMMADKMDQQEASNR